MSGKAMFAALPLRAIGDTRLSALHLRVLACIAFHDRMSGARGKGQGAWASNETLARRVGCHYTYFSTAVTELGRFGYLEKEPHPLNKRLRVFRVVYDTGAPLPDSLPDDKVLSPSGRVQPLRGASVAGEPSIVGQPANDPGAIVCPASENAQSDQQFGTVEYISLSDVRYSAEAGEDIPHKWRAAKAPRVASKGVSFSEGEPIHQSLAKFERAFNNDRAQFIPHLREWQDWLHDVAETHLGLDDAAANRALRLWEQTSEWADNATGERGGNLREAAAVARAMLDPVAQFWAGANRLGKAKLAENVGLTAAEVDRYVRGIDTLPFAKCAALRSACARA